VSLEFLHVKELHQNSYQIHGSAVYLGNLINKASATLKDTNNLSRSYKIHIKVLFQNRLNVGT